MKAVWLKMVVVVVVSYESSMVEGGVMLRRGSTSEIHGVVRLLILKAHQDIKILIVKTWEGWHNHGL